MMRTDVASRCRATVAIESAAQGKKRLEWAVASHNSRRRQMLYQVIVVFGKDKEYEFKMSDVDLAGRSAEEARRWFDKEFADLECEPSNPVGKVLIIDKILGVARGGGEARFAAGK